MAWFYLSFADENSWFGGAMVDADDIKSAIQKAWRMGINPGGEVAFGQMDADFQPPPPEYCNRLLKTHDDLREAVRASGHEDDALVDGNGRIVSPKTGTH